MALFFYIAILSLAVAVGGLAAIWRERGRRAIPAIRTFAIVAAAAIAVLHLAPEAIANAGPIVLVATAAGFLVPTVLERIVLGRSGPSHDPHHHAPTGELAAGYAAVIAHQAGEGAAVASMARAGSLSLGVVLALAAHTVPLAMVVAIRVLEVKAGDDGGGRRATAIALFGVALATVLGALAGNTLVGAELASIEPWILATVAGLLLHALSHEVFVPTAETFAGRVADATAGLLGLALAAAGAEEEWAAALPAPVRAAGLVVLSAAIVARSFVRRAPRPRHEERAVGDETSPPSRS